MVRIRLCVQLSLKPGNVRRGVSVLRLGFACLSRFLPRYVVLGVGVLRVRLAG